MSTLDQRVSTPDAVDVRQEQSVPKKTENGVAGLKISTKSFPRNKSLSILCCYSTEDEARGHIHQRLTYIDRVIKICA